MCTEDYEEATNSILETNNATTNNENEEPFPYKLLPIQDAHCHPLEDPTSLSNLDTMHTSALTVFATRIEDQPLMASIASKHTSKIATLSHDTKIIPSFGYHPWFSHTFYDDLDNPISVEEASVPECRELHYTTVLHPPPAKDQIPLLPELTPLSHALNLLRENLAAYPLAMVGEIGLDKPFRLPVPWTSRAEEDTVMALGPAGRPRGGRCRRQLSDMKVAIWHQKIVLREQLRVAAELGRPVSVHGVACHGVLFEIISGLWKGQEKVSMNATRKKERRGGVNFGPPNPQLKSETEAKPMYPPRICLHSFSGKLDTAKQYFRSSVPAEMYVTFAWCNNFSTESAGRKAEEVIAWVPERALLVESDLHSIGKRSDEYLERMARKVFKIRGWSLEEGCKILRANWRRFVTGEEMKGG